MRRTNAISTTQQESGNDGGCDGYKGEGVMGFDIYGKAFEPSPGSPHPFVENVATFAAFLRESGGFSI